MTSINNTITLIEKHFQEVLNQEDKKKNILVINEIFNNLDLNVPIREFLILHIKAFRSVSESKACFSIYPQQKKITVFIKTI